MVAISGTQHGQPWLLAPSLVACVDEADRLWPNRRRTSDGSIGDAAHQLRDSDHNPALGIVHALDLSHDPAGGLDAHTWADELRRRHDPRIKYVISAGRIFASYDRPWRSAWRWGNYTGANQHHQHVHVSVLATVLGESRTSPWFTDGRVVSPPPVLKIADRPYPGVIRPGDGMPPHPPSAAVRAWQHALQARGYPELAADGRFGDVTHLALVHWQRNHLALLGPRGDDGIGGPKTWHTLLYA